MKTITINGKEYNLKYTLRALFIFEQITKKAFKIESLLDNYIFFYSLILANNKDNPIDWDEFINAMDEDSTLLLKMNELLNDQNKMDNLFNDGDNKEVKKN